MKPGDRFQFKRIHPDDLEYKYSKWLSLAKCGDQDEKLVVEHLAIHPEKIRRIKDRIGMCAVTKSGLYCPLDLIEPYAPRPIYEKGQRIKFLYALGQGPTDETPAFTFAEKGSMGVVDRYLEPGPKENGYVEEFEYSVFWDGFTKAPFKCHAWEFEVVK